MPRKLDVEVSRVNWLLHAEDLELLRAVHPNEVNTIGRAIIHAYCNRIREQLASRVPHHI